jgi:hypothetical protein
MSLQVANSRDALVPCPPRGPCPASGIAAFGRATVCFAELGDADDPRPLHSWHLQALECLDGATHGLVRMVFENLAKDLLRLGLHD